jgi:formamidopyrimidine-DNA glycosylase
MNDEIEEGFEEEVYVKDGNFCPRCQCALVEEQTFGYERITTCSHCDYFASKTIE